MPINRPTKPRIRAGPYTRGFKNLFHLGSRVREVDDEDDAEDSGYEKRS